MDVKDRAQEELRVASLQPGDRYRHYKGGEYEVVSCVIKEDTLEPLVIYKSLAKGTLWARTLADWNAEVTVGGRRVKRFERLKLPKPIEVKPL